MVIQNPDGPHNKKNIYTKMRDPIKEKVEKPLYPLGMFIFF